MKRLLSACIPKRSTSPSSSRSPKPSALTPNGNGTATDPYARDPRKPKPASSTKLSPPARPLHIFLPLYIYPLPGAWDPLYSALSAHPDTTFSIIVNPGSGPGEGRYPDSNYTECVSRLHEYPNAHILGYVSTQYAKRDQALVEEDIRKYADWASWEAEGSSGSIAVDGIFFDEAPSQHNDETSAYMSSISTYAKSTLPPDHSHVTFNPGVICDAKFFEMADEVVVCEDGYAMFGMDILRFVEAELKGKSSVVVHGFNGSGEEMGDMVRGLAEEGFKGVYITTEGGYTGWGALWEVLGTSVARTGGGRG